MRERHSSRAVTILVIIWALSLGQSLGMQTEESDGSGTIQSQARTNAELFQLIIEIDKPSFSSEEPIQLHFHLRNVSKQLLVVKEIAAWRDYMLDVRTESGQKVPLTQFGQSLASMRQGKRDEHRVRFRKLNPEEELNDSLELKNLYKLIPGVPYLITARRSIYSGVGKGVNEIASNTIKLRIIT